MVNNHWLMVWNHGIWIDFPIILGMECHHPNWRSPSFFRGVGQPPTRFFLLNFCCDFMCFQSLEPWEAGLPLGWREPQMSTSQVVSVIGWERNFWLPPYLDISWYFMIFLFFFGHSPIHFGDTMSYCNWNPNVILFGYTHLFFFLVLELQPRPSRSLSYIPSISHSSVPLLDSSPFSRGLPCPDAWAYIGHQLACLAHARMHCS